MPSSSHPSTVSRRTFAPVATSAWPKDTSSFVDSVATRCSASSFVTLVRVISSASFSPHHSGAARRICSFFSSPRR